MNQNNTMVVIAVIVLLVIGALIISSKDKTNDMVVVPVGETGSQGDVTIINNNSTTTSTTTLPVVKSFTVNAKDYSFSPTTLTVKKGDMVKLTVNNTGGVHDLKIDAFNAVTPMLQNGMSATIEFLADKAGSYEYYCSVGNHRAMGMKGTLVVTE